MRRILRALPLLLIVALFAFALVGCGGDDSESASDTTTAIETTEDTETEATETEATETETIDDDVDFGSSEECRNLAELSRKVQEAASGAGSDIEQSIAALEELADEGPEEIRDDFRVLADFLDKIKDIGLEQGETPTPDQIQKLQELSTQDTQRLSEAGQNITNWVNENCS